MTILIFVLVLFLLILVHEWGHFIAAKKTHMRVDEFGIGFPPRITGIKRGETLYSINALLIGGFVKIYGEDSVGTDGPDYGRSFVSKPKWAQIVVLIAGVGMNVLFAWLLFSAALSIGIHIAVSESDATESATLMITGVLKDSPASVVGLKTGAEITSLSYGNESLSSLTPSAFSLFVAGHSTDELTITYLLHGETKTTTVIPKEGLIAGETTQPAIGVALVLTEIVRKPMYIAVYEGAKMTVVSLRDIVVGLSGLIYDAVRMEADFSEVAGPVGIVGLVGEASAFGLTTLLMFTAFISLNLAIINLLPFPALDGGRLLFVVIEMIKGSPIRSSIVHSVNMIGFALLVLLMVAVTFNDVLRII